jgi:hypothetical protein
MVPAANGRVLTVTVNGAEAGPDPQELVPCTLIAPLTADAEKLTVILLVLAPATILDPAGKVQL